MIPDDEIDRIKRETDLAAVIRSRGVELKPQGHDLLGLCPFHEDHSPSMRVTPGKGLWRCMSCGATGNVIQFVQRFDGVSFRHAYELLKNGAAFTGAPACQPVKKSTVPRLESPLTADAAGSASSPQADQEALRQVLDYYHARLKENPLALAYLKKRGIAAEAIDAFKLGFVDRTLGLRLPNNQRKEGAALRDRLTRLGLLRDTGHEHFRGRIVFPVVAESGEIGTVYGRAIDDRGKHDRHLFLPGPQRGIWNSAALRNPEVIVTEGIIDALTFWSAGFRYVTTGYSAKALPDELLAALVAAKVSRVFIAYDRDEAGDKGAAEVAAQLAAYGIECLRVMFPHGHDANSYALAVTPPEKSLGVLLRSALPMGETGKGKVSSHVAPAPSSLAAKAAKEEAAELVPPASEGKTGLATPPEEAAREKNNEAVPSAQLANAPGSPKPSGEGGSPVAVVKNEPDEIVLLLGDREWRVRGLSKNSGFESLKVTLRVSVIAGETCHAVARQSEGGWHLDNLDLCVARQRAAFIETAAAETLLKAELVKRDLGHVLRKLEELQEARLKAQTQPKKAVAAELSAELRERALAVLRDPKLLDRVLAAFALCGIVGEELNLLVGYLASVSRKLSQPLAIIIQSTSAAGKSALMEAILAFVPPEERVKYSALTGQALYYLGGETSLKHKILAIVEEEGAEKASYALKLLQSEGELSIASTGKDPATGRMVTQEYRVEGPVMIFLTTTAVDIDEELMNRCLVLTVDESREQTRRIHMQQRARYTLGGIAAAEDRAGVLALHRAMQALLRPYEVHIPWVDRLTFLDDKTRTRRDHNKYLQIIAAVALVHQYQREIRPVRGAGGKTVPCVVATLDDIAAANRLAHETLGRCLDEMPPQTRRLLGLVWQMVRDIATREKLEPSRVWVTRRQIREYTGWNHSQLAVHLGRLAELEYVLLRRGEGGQPFVYELIYDGAGQDGGKFFPGLFDVEKLRREQSMPTTADLPGGNAVVPGLFRPGSGPVPGAFRPGENADSPSEKRAPESKNDENARPGPEKNDAAA
jgi:DNA primase catalytic core